MTTIAPWLSMDNCQQAIDFYSAAFDAVVTYQLIDPEGGQVVRLAIDGAEFWLSGGPSPQSNNQSKPLGDNSIRFILTTADPDRVFTKAITAGATVIFGVDEAHGWRLGRLVDPFGLHWEIGHPLADS